MHLVPDWKCLEQKEAIRLGEASINAAERELEEIARKVSSSLNYLTKMKNINFSMFERMIISQEYTCALSYDDFLNSLLEVSSNNAHMCSHEIIIHLTLKFYIFHIHRVVGHP